MGGPRFARIERPITFDYDLRMRCERCDKSSDLSGADYIRLNIEAAARMECEHCHDPLHFGPLVADIRDQDDPALTDDMVNRLSWYHTSIYSTWPSTDYERDVRAAFATAEARGMFGNPERYLDGQLTKALHLGTYEAAIENMHRRMRDQDGSTAEFYLHRVAVDIDSTRINPGFRDENDEPAAHITLTELQNLDLEAIRYLNVWEATGCISLAVDPHVIAGIQTVRVPPPVSQSHGLEHLVEDLTSRHAAAADSSEDAQFRAYDLMDELDAALVARHLTDVSPVVAEHFVRAISRIQPHGANDFEGKAQTFARHAVLLTQHRDIVKLFETIDVRTPT